MKKFIPAFALMSFSEAALALQPVSVNGAVDMLIYLVIVGLIFWCIWWFIGYVGVPEPFNKVIRVVMALIALLIVLSLLLGMLGHPIFR